MNWDRVEGQWMQIKGSIKERWGKLTEDDLNVIGGKREQLVGRVQERYGIAKDEARKQVADWSQGAADASGTDLNHAFDRKAG